MGFPQPAAPVGTAGGALSGSYPSPTLAQPIDMTGALTTTDLMTVDVTGDTQFRYVLNADGGLQWGPGNGALDVTLYRSAANKLATDDGLALLNGALAGGSNVGSTLYSGTGAPNNANGANGDLYFRVDGGALTTVYQRRAGAWVGII